MNPLAEAYVRQQIKINEHRELSRLAVEIRQKQAEIAPMIKKNMEMKRERLRQDGSDGFKMVFKEYN